MKSPTPKTNNTQCENPKCACTDCKCDPCECNGTSCCGKSGEACSSTWCNWKHIIFCVILLASILLNIVLLSDHDRYDRDDSRKIQKTGMMNHDMDMDDMNSHDPMDMSMRDMSAMLVGKNGDELNRAFLEGMIPHHQAAVDMAAFLAASNKPELVKLGWEIITAQTKEIEQMKQWMVDWGYTASGSTGTGMMNHSMMTPQM